MAHPKRSTRRRVVSKAERSTGNAVALAGEFLPDPFLADAMEGYEHAFQKLQDGTESDMQETACLLCEFSREIMIRLWPLSDSFLGTISKAHKLFKETLDHLDAGPATTIINRYRENIAKRERVFAQFLKTHAIR
jgi:hypothetical protein